MVSKLIDGWRLNSTWMRAAREGRENGWSGTDLLAHVRDAAKQYESDDAAASAGRALGFLAYVIATYPNYLSASKILAEAEGTLPRAKATPDERREAVRAFRKRDHDTLESIAVEAGYNTVHNVFAVDRVIEKGFLRTKRMPSGITVYIASAEGQEGCKALVRGRAYSDEDLLSLAYYGFVNAVGVLGMLDYVAFISRNIPKVFLPYRHAHYGTNAARLLADEAATARRLM